jgi:acyl-CoA thioesterase
MKPVKTGTLTANAKLVSKSSKIATYIVEVVNEKKELIALMQGTVYNKQKQVFQKT